ncbi:hypothetical protein [Streptomyces sp. NPDC058664]|uniref:hypothetical protein n=1 Tax=unclassified Streptomyces TaxID=2593676 RepID=UPI003656D32D
MGGNPRRPQGLVRLAAVGVAAVAGAALLSGWDGDGTAGRAEGQAPGRTAAVPAAAAPAAPSPSADDVRTLEQGRTLTVAISPNDLFDIPASSAEVTLTALKQADRLPQGEHLDPEVAERGMTFVCLEFKVENASTEEFDTSPLTRARWTGKDGETTKVEQEIGGNCAALGLVEENLLTEPDPRPGEFVRGTTVFAVPDGQAGVLEFADGLDHPLFKVETKASR